MQMTGNHLGMTVFKLFRNSASNTLVRFQDTVLPTKAFEAFSKKRIITLTTCTLISEGRQMLLAFAIVMKWGSCLSAYSKKQLILNVTYNFTISSVVFCFFFLLVWWFLTVILKSLHVIM